MPREGRVGALTGACLMDQCGLPEYSSKESYEGGLQQFFREQMRSFCDVLRQKSSFPFI
jgi:hypothetical protein